MNRMLILILLFPVMMIGQVHDFEPVYGTSEFIGDSLVIIDGDTGKIGKRLNPVSEGYVVCEKQRDSLILGLNRKITSIGLYEYQPNSIIEPIGYNLILFCEYKKELIENGTCKITPEETVMMPSPTKNGVSLDILVYETIPADTSWIYDKPTFEEFMEWKIKNLIDE